MRVHARRRGVGGPAGPAGGRLGVDLWCFDSPRELASKTAQRSILLAYSRCRPRFGPLMPAGPRKPVERHNGRIYWPTRDVAVSFVDFFLAPGRILGTQTFRAAGVVRILPTHTFSGCRHICILPTQTFRVAGGFAFYLHTLSTTLRALLLRNQMKSIRKVCYILKMFSRCARRSLFFFRRSIKKSIRK